METQFVIEEWRGVVGHGKLYEISNLGNGRIPKKLSSDGRMLKAKPKKLTPDKDGYLNFSVYIAGKVKTLKTHREVLKAFVGPCPEGMECCHLDSVRANNKLTNLKWASKTENQGGDRNKNGSYSSKYNGVYWSHQGQKWVSSVWVNPKQRYIGRFTEEVDAAKAFNDYCDLHKLNKHRNTL